MIDLPLRNRNCPCCQSLDFEQVWQSENIVKKSKEAYLFRVHVVVCKICGFCFTSPCIDSEALKAYYADGLSHYKGIALPYSIERRVALLQKYRVPDGVFAEISGDQPEAFHEACRSFFKTFHNVEMSEDIPSDYRSVDDLADATIDVIVHYDVLEHVPDVKPFLLSCSRALKPNGIMVCEVPDARMYPRNLLLYEFEHVNHFSVHSLASIGQMCGFRLIEVDHNSSRRTGFAAVFRKDESLLDQVISWPSEYIDMVSVIQGGVFQVQNARDQVEQLKENILKISASRQQITLWGVTDLLRYLLDGFQIPEGVIVVDSDPRRRDHLREYGVEVRLPENALDEIKKSQLLGLFAVRYKSEILEWIREKTGRQFLDQELALIGSGPSGESLL